MLGGMLPIPWYHSLADFGSVWQWKTSHFVVTVTSDSQGRSFYWRLNDISSGSERFIVDGQASSFGQAEAGVREAVGKTYSPKLGFVKYAGSYATTFVLATGAKKDLGVYDGFNVIVEVADRDGDVRTVKGVARLSHYNLLVIHKDTTYRIAPSYVLSIRADGEVSPKDDPTSEENVSRVVQGVVIAGCTGRPGFLANTVDHVGRKCPIHE